MRKGADIVPQVYLRAGFISGTPLDRWSKVDTPSPVGGEPENGCHQASSLGRVQASGPAKSRRHSITARCSASVPVVRFASCDRRGEWRRGAACFADWDAWSRSRTFFESTSGPTCACAFIPPPRHEIARKVLPYPPPTGRSRRLGSLAGMHQIVVALPVRRRFCRAIAVQAANNSSR